VCARLEVDALRGNLWPHGIRVNTNQLSYETPLARRCPANEEFRTWVLGRIKLALQLQANGRHHGEGQHGDIVIRR